MVQPDYHQFFQYNVYLYVSSKSVWYWKCITSFVLYIIVAWKIILRTRRIYIQSYIPNKLLDNWRLFVFTHLFPNNMDLKVANILLKNLFALDVNSKFYKWLEIFLTRRIQCQIRGTTRITPWTDIILYIMVFIRR